MIQVSWRDGNEQSSRPIYIEKDPEVFMPEKYGSSVIVEMWRPSCDECHDFNLRCVKDGDNVILVIPSNNENCIRRRLVHDG